MEAVAMIHRKRPKPASYFNVEHEFVTKRSMIILTEAADFIRCDGQKRADHFHYRLSIIRGILVISFMSEQ
jgi:hypothetical protein